MNGSSLVPEQTISETAIREGQSTPSPNIPILPESTNETTHPARRLKAIQSALALLFGGMTLFLFSGYISRTYFSHAGPAQLFTGEELKYQVDVNHAGRMELMELPGIGPKMADRIIKHRARMGPFQSISDLQSVPGIGTKTVERLQPWICLDGKKGDSFSLRKSLTEPNKFEWAQKQPAWDGKPVNINKATEERLQVLPRIGPVLAKRIVDDRELNGPFLSVDHLSRVKGIGVKTVERLRPYCVVE